MKPFAELGRYGIVGLIGTAAHYTVMAVLLNIFLFDVVLATTLGAIIGAIINYVLNYFYTFRSDKGHMEAMVKFWLIAVCGWIINAAIMALNEYVVGFHVIPAQLMATAVVFVITFLMNKRWTF